MSHDAAAFSHVRIVRCPHGTNFVTLGNLTLTLCDTELALIDRAIHKLAQQHPRFQQTLFAGLCANNAAYHDEVS